MLSADHGVTPVALVRPSTPVPDYRIAPR